MRSKVHNAFSGSINGYEFKNEMAFYDVCDIMNALEEANDLIFNEPEIPALLSEAYFKYQNLGLSSEKFKDSCIKNIKKGSYKFLPKNKKTKEFNELMKGLIINAKHDMKKLQVVEN